MKKYPLFSCTGLFFALHGIVRRKYSVPQGYNCGFQEDKKPSLTKRQGRLSDYSAGNGYQSRLK
jgi:hypothetical protein